MKHAQYGGGWPAIWYTIKMGKAAGFRNMWKALFSKNTCKACALGMGGQGGGMIDEQGHWPEICKKSIQAMASDMQDKIRPDFFNRFTIEKHTGFNWSFSNWSCTTYIRWNYRKTDRIYKNSRLFC